MAAGSEVDSGGDDDPLARLSLDDEIVRGAEVQEAASDERDARRRAVERAHRRSRRRPRWVPLGVVVVVAALIGWFVLFEDDGGSGAGDLVGGTAADEPTETTVATTPPTPEPLRPGWPPPSEEQQSAPVGAPAPLATESASYQFSEVQRRSTEPVAFDPCRPIHVVHNLNGAPPEAPTLLAQALQDVSLATGLQFIVDGETDEAPEPLGRRNVLLHRYGDRWAPVLVVWSDEATVPDLAGDAVGAARASWVDVDGARVYVTGDVILDAPDLLDAMNADGNDAVTSVVRHELAHVVGLGHVDDAAELMYPEAIPGVVTFGPGDLTGLARLGRGQCFPDL